MNNKKRGQVSYYNKKEKNKTITMPEKHALPQKIQDITILFQNKLKDNDKKHERTT